MLNIGRAYRKIVLNFGMPMGAAQLRHAVHAQHGGKATLVTKLPIKDIHDGQTVWEGVVYIFDLEGHPGATGANAWSSLVEGSANRRFFSVLHLDGIRSPLDAVRAAIAIEHKAL